MERSESQSIQVFLSHKYEAPEINQYFFRLFSRANLQFEVDKGKYDINVTRLERMIRDADAFFAIFAYDNDGSSTVSDADLLERSKYFRLELDLAARAGKPALAFVDKRFRGVIETPSLMLRESFDVREITGAGAKPSSTRYEMVFSKFLDQVVAHSNSDLSLGSPARDSETVGILLPTGSQNQYGSADVDAVVDAVKRARYRPVLMKWPASITPAWISEVLSCNWIVADVGDGSLSSGVAGFVHGLFVPTMRLLRVGSEPEAKPRRMPESALFGGVEAGYWKDIARWWDTASLRAEIEKRLFTLDAPTRRFGTLDEALEYFQQAAKRKESVFISYSGDDEEVSRELRAELAKRFRDVFDYRDGKSIRPGQPWLEEISSSLAASPICVALLSPTYAASDHCMHELRDAVALRDSKQTRIFPVIVRRDASFRVPGIISSTQYMDLAAFPKVQDLVNNLIASLDQKSQSAET